jgi:hypothetical protein
LDQNKQPNWFYFFLVLEPKTSSNRLISVWFGSGFFPFKPVQTEITPVVFCTLLFYRQRIGLQTCCVLYL